MIADRFDVHRRVSSANLPKDESLRSTIRRNCDPTGDNPTALFPRQIDFWFAAVAYAIHEGLDPSTAVESSEFVKVGPTQEHVRLHDWQMTILTALYLRDQDGFVVEGFNPDAIDTTAGKVDEQGEPRGRSEVIANANRYACVGAQPLADKLFGDNFGSDTPEKLAAMALIPVVNAAEARWEEALTESTE